MKRQEFLSLVINNLISDKISINLYQECNICDCGGWFDSRGKEFVIAMKSNSWFEILLHEYCHYLQWKNNRKFFNMKTTSCGILFSWLENEDYSDNIIKKAINDIIEIEWDCEINALKLIKQYKLDIDVDQYIKSANACLLFYHMVHQSRKWCIGSPYGPKITRTMPSQLNSLDFYRNPDTISPKQRELYLKII